MLTVKRDQHSLPFPQERYDRLKQQEAELFSLGDARGTALLWPKALDGYNTLDTANTVLRIEERSHTVRTSSLFSWRRGFIEGISVQTELLQTLLASEYYLVQQCPVRQLVILHSYHLSPTAYSVNELRLSVGLPYLPELEGYNEITYRR